MKYRNQAFLFILFMGLSLLLFSHSVRGMNLVMRKSVPLKGTSSMLKVRNLNQKRKKAEFSKKIKQDSYRQLVEKPVNNLVQLENYLPLASFKMQEIRTRIDSEELFQMYVSEVKKLGLTNTQINKILEYFKESLRDVTKELLQSYDNKPFSRGIGSEEFYQQIVLDWRIQRLIGAETGLATLLDKIIKNYVDKIYQSIIDSFVKEQQISELVNDVKLSEKLGVIESARPAVGPEALINISQYDPQRFMRLQERGKLVQLTAMPDYVRNDLLTHVRKQFPTPQERIEARGEINKNFVQFFSTGLRPNVADVFQKSIINRNPTISLAEATEISRVVDLSLSLNAIAQGVQDNLPVENSDEADNLLLSYVLAVYDISPAFIRQSEQRNPLVQDFFSRDFQSIQTIDESGAVSSIIIKRPGGGLVTINSATSIVPFDKKTFELVEKDFWQQSESVDDIINQALLKELSGEKQEATLFETPEEWRFEEVIEAEPEITEISAKSEEELSLESKEKQEALRLQEEIKMLEKSEQQRIARLVEEEKQRELDKQKEERLQEEQKNQEIERAERVAQELVTRDVKLIEIKKEPVILEEIKEKLPVQIEQGEKLPVIQEDPSIKLPTVIEQPISKELIGVYEDVEKLPVVIEEIGNKLVSVIEKVEKLPVIQEEPTVKLSMATEEPISRELIGVYEDVEKLPVVIEEIGNKLVSVIEKVEKLPVVQDEPSTKLLTVIEEPISRELIGVYEDVEKLPVVIEEIGNKLVSVIEKVEKLPVVQDEPSIKLPTVIEEPISRDLIEVYDDIKKLPVVIEEIGNKLVPVIEKVEKLPVIKEEDLPVIVRPLEEQLPAVLSEDIRAQEQVEIVEIDHYKDLQEFIEVQNEVMRLAIRKAENLPALYEPKEIIIISEKKDQLPLVREEKLPTEFEGKLPVGVGERSSEEIEKRLEEEKKRKEIVKERDRKKELVEKKDDEKKAPRPGGDGGGQPFVISDSEKSGQPGRKPSVKPTTTPQRKKYPVPTFNPLESGRPSPATGSSRKPIITPEKDDKRFDAAEKPLQERDESQYPGRTYPQDGSSRPSQNKGSVGAPGLEQAPSVSGYSGAGGASGGGEAKEAPFKTKRPWLWALLAFLVMIILGIIRRRLGM